MSRLRRSPRVWARRAAGAFAALILASCTPLYLPPVPGDALMPEPRLRISGASTLETVVDEGRLRLLVEVLEVPHEGWLAVQWFGPAGGARASESLWLVPADAGAVRELRTPEALELVPGEWRAVLSWYGTVVRQLRVEVPSTAVP